MAKAILKTVERKTTVSRDAISGAFAVARGIAKPKVEPAKRAGEKKNKKNTPASKKSS